MTHRRRFLTQDSAEGPLVADSWSGQEWSNLYPGRAPSQRRKVSIRQRADAIFSGEQILQYYISYTVHISD